METLTLTFAFCDGFLERSARSDRAGECINPHVVGVVHSVRRLDGPLPLPPRQVRGTRINQKVDMWLH